MPTPKFPGAIGRRLVSTLARVANNGLSPPGTDACIALESTGERKGQDGAFVAGLRAARSADTRGTFHAIEPQMPSHKRLRDVSEAHGDKARTAMVATRDLMINAAAERFQCSARRPSRL